MEEPNQWPIHLRTLVNPWTKKMKACSVQMEKILTRLNAW
jgi:hypothetical protein